MSIYVSIFDIERYRDSFSDLEVPNLLKAVETLERLVEWVDSNSDGWPYWQKPRQAATKLMTLIVEGGKDSWGGREIPDITEADLKKALTPIKSFLTRQGANPASVLEPEPYCNHDPAAIYPVGDTYHCECGQEMKPVFVPATA
jgi:hypothetical protein